MEKEITKICPASELRNILMGFGVEPYIVKRIERSGEDYILTLKKDE